MIKLKKLLKESFERKFGEPLITLDSVMKDHQLGKLYTDKDKPPFKTEKQIEEEKLNEVMGNVVVIDRKYIPKIAHVRKVLKLKMGKDLSVYKTDSNNVYHKVSDSQIKRFLDRLDRFDVKYKLGESVDESQKRQSSEITAKFDKAYLNFAREVRDVISRMDRSTGDKTDGKIIAKAYTKYLLPLDKLMQSWNKTQQKNPHLDESVNEAIEPSGIMAKINKIVQSKQAAKIDGVLLDMFSANIMMRIFNAVNDKSKKDMNKGTMRQVKVILHKVMKQNKVRESVNEAPLAFSSSEAKQQLDRDIGSMSKILGKASQQIIKIMMDGVKGGKYDAMDISRGIETGPLNRTHEGERPFMKMLWRKVRDGFRRYSSKGKLRK